MPEFELLFNQVLMYSDTIDEFQHFWDIMVTEFDCATHPWIVNLFKAREKWCFAFTKDRFSGGILSSQRSESTNNSVSRRLHKTASLHELYKCFCQVIAEWRSNEKHEDTRCWEGYPHIAVPNLPILSHASQVYTIEAFNILQDNFLSGMTCKYKPHECDDILYSFIVWKPTSELFAHVVCFNLQSKEITCTCKQFHEVGILCCHALRIYFKMCIEEIPEKYIIPRWTRAVIKPATDDEEVISSRSKALVSQSSTIWTLALQRNWNRLINTSSSNLEARRVCKDAYDNAKKEIEDKLGLITIGEDIVTSPNQQGIQIRDPKGAWTPGRRNKRPKGTRAKIDNRIRTRQRIVRNYKQKVSSPAFINSTATSSALDD